MLLLLPLPPANRSNISWESGKPYCALIHHYYPGYIDLNEVSDSVSAAEAINCPSPRIPSHRYYQDYKVNASIAHEAMNALGLPGSLIPGAVALTSSCL